MSIFIRLFASFLLFALFSFFSQAPAQPTEKTKTGNKWVSIFDGKTLNGWKASQDGYFSVEDGAITGSVVRKQDGPITRVFTTGDEEPQAAFLVWEGGNVSNFNLRFKARLIGSMAHAGVHFRSVINEQKLMSGYQVDISELGRLPEGILGKRPFENYASAGQCNLINNAGAKIVTSFAGEDTLLKEIDFTQWVSYEISARGSHVILRTNGQKILEFIDQRSDSVPKAGVLAIALYPFSEMKIQIKDIALQEISPGLANDSETALSIKNIHLIDELKTALDVGTAQKALSLLQQNPHLTHSMFGIRTNAADRGGSLETPLLLASLRGHGEVVKWLIAHGAVINQACYNNFLPIHWAANAEIARMLITAGADLNALTSSSETPLQYAAGHQRTDVVNAILASGYKLDIISAIRMGRRDLVARIIKDDPSTINLPKTNEKDRWRQQESPLMTAVRYENIEITELLLNAGADVNDKYSLAFRSGPPHCGTVTALSIAVVFSRIDLITLLLQHGANPKVDCDGRSLLAYAREYRTPEIVALLEKEWPQKPR